VAKKVSFQEIGRAANSITFAEMISILRDFKVLPRLINKQELQQVWQCRSRDEDNNFYRELTYNEFEDCLARCALLAFPKLGQLNMHNQKGRHSDEFKVRAFIKYLGLDSMSFIRNKLRTAGRSTAGQLNFGVCSDTNERLHLDRHDRRVAENFAPNTTIAATDKIRQAARAATSALSYYDPRLADLFEPYHTAPTCSQWECYKAPFIDMGTVLRNKSYRFKVELCNRSSYLLQVTPSLPSGQSRLHGVRIVSNSKSPQTLAPGLTHTVELEANFSKYRPTIAEKYGALTIEISSLRNSKILKERIQVPLYLNISNPGSFTAASEGKSLVPHKEAHVRPASAPCRFSKTSAPYLLKVGSRDRGGSAAAGSGGRYMNMNMDGDGSSSSSNNGALAQTQQQQRRPHTASMDYPTRLDRFQDGRQMYQ